MQRNTLAWFWLALLVPATTAAQPASEPPAPAPASTEPPSPEPPPPPGPGPAVVEETPPLTPEAPPPPPPKDPATKGDSKPKTPWYDRLAVRGYAQIRYNRLYATEDEFRNDLGDRAIADNNTFSIRRARFIVSGDATPFLAIYLQSDFAGADAKMRDWYADVFVDREKQLRFRVGQSKVPYGWENLQSSQNRAPLDRSDPLNSAVPGERDLGVFAYWETPAARKLFKHLVDSGLKGSGDYGMAALGVYQGQTLNVDDKNRNVHVVARFTYPFRVGTQIIEAGAAAYIGKYTVNKDMAVLGDPTVRDMRAQAHLIVYPQPIGFQAEYSVGKGPELVEDTIRAENLHGGYAMLLAKLGPLVPFARGAYYDGAYKSFQNAPRAEVKELALGAEYMIHERLELVVEVDHAQRVVGDDSVWGTVVRSQAQFNY